MSKVMFLCFFVAFLIQNVVSLSCYVSDRSSNLQGVIINNKEDCQLFVAEIRRTYSIPQNENITMSCYTVSFPKHFKGIFVKGCVPEGGCKEIKQEYKERLPLVPVNCEECQNEDYCNN